MADDWVGAFNDDTCVGAWKWNTTLCNNGICTIPVFGETNEEWTTGYMQIGDIPTFKIYDASKNKYYEAVVSSDCHLLGETSSCEYMNNEMFYANYLIGYEKDQKRKMENKEI